MGAEISVEGWTWLHSHLHAGRAASLAGPGTCRSPHRHVTGYHFHPRNKGSNALDDLTWRAICAGPCSLVRGSAAAVQRELLSCYELIESIGRGVVYYGSARLKAESPHFIRSRQLGREVQVEPIKPTLKAPGPQRLKL